MLNFAPEVYDFLEQVRESALGYEGAEEYSPWGTRAFFREVKGRNFLFVIEQPDHLEVLVRLYSRERAVALGLPFVETHKSMGNRGWVSVKIRRQEELDRVLPWIKLSYDLNKPFRTKADYMEGETVEILDFLEQVRQVALGYKDIEEYFPFGDRAFRKRKGKIFVYASESDEHLYVNVRLPLGEREDALELPFVEVPKYLGHRGWVGAKVRTQEELDTVLPWIQTSYELNNPPRKSRLKKLS